MKTVKFDRKRRFFYHYNKPATQKTGKPSLTLHINNACHVIDGTLFQVHCPCESKVYPNKQPRLVMRGWCSEVTFTDKGGAIVK